MLRPLAMRSSAASAVRRTASGSIGAASAGITLATSMPSLLHADESHPLQPDDGDLPRSGQRDALHDPLVDRRVLPLDGRDRSDRMQVLTRWLLDLGLALREHCDPRVTGERGIDRPARARPPDLEHRALVGKHDDAAHRDQRQPRRLEPLHQLVDRCPVEGEKLPELFEPLVAFAKARLMGKLDRYGLEPDAKVTAKWATKDDRTRGLVILVDARSRAGELVVGNWWSDGGHSFHYCIRIVHEESGTTVLVHEQWSAIS